MCKAGPTRCGFSRTGAYYDVDYLEFRPFTPPSLLPITPTLVDEQANARTRFLMNYLTDMYGEKTLSGQQHSTQPESAVSGAELSQ